MNLEELKKKLAILSTSVRPGAPGLVKEQRLVRLFEIRSALRTSYGSSYRDVSEGLALIRNGDGAFAADEREGVIEQIEELRKMVVLGFKSMIRRVEIAINELAPGSFDHSGGPAQSGDVDMTDIHEWAKWGAGLAALLAMGGAAGAAAVVASGSFGLETGASIVDYMTDGGTE